MGVYIGLFEFDGLDLSPRDLLDQPGVYAIFHHFKNEYDFIDTGEHESVFKRVNSLDFEDMQAKFPGTVSFAAYYTNGTKEARRSIVESIKREFDQEPRVEHQYEH